MNQGRLFAIGLIGMLSLSVIGSRGFAQSDADEKSKYAQPPQQYGEKRAQDEKSKYAQPPQQYGEQRAQDEKSKYAQPPQQYDEQRAQDEKSKYAQPPQQYDEQRAQDEKAKYAQPPQQYDERRAQDEKAKYAQPPQQYDERRAQDEKAKYAQPPQQYDEQRAQDEKAKYAQPPQQFDEQRAQDEKAKYAQPPQQFDEQRARDEKQRAIDEALKHSHPSNADVQNSIDDKQRAIDEALKRAQPTTSEKESSADPARIVKPRLQPSELKLIVGKSPKWKPEKPLYLLGDGSTVQLLPASEVNKVKAELILFLNTDEQKEVRMQMFALRAGAAPDVVDLTPWQTPFRNQLARGTCINFSAVAAVEAAYKHAEEAVDFSSQSEWQVRPVGPSLDLSEQHLEWIKYASNIRSGVASSACQSFPNKVENLVVYQSGGGGFGSLDLMTRYGICSESAMPYIGSTAIEDSSANGFPRYRECGLTNYMWNNNEIPQRGVNKFNFHDLVFFPSRVLRDSLYGVGSVVLLSASEAANASVIERILAQGHEVVLDLNLYAFHTNPPVPGMWKRAPGANPGAGHSVLVVGYDRRRRFFIVKNSWGPVMYAQSGLSANYADIVPKWQGYTLMDYDYLPCATSACYIGSLPFKPYRFDDQKFLRKWYLTIRDHDTSRVVDRAVLCWRHLPNTAAHLNRTADKRIGDLYLRSPTTPDVRVNGIILSPDLKRKLLHASNNRPRVQIMIADTHVDLNVTALRRQPSNLRTVVFYVDLRTGNQTYAEAFGTTIYASLDNGALRNGEIIDCQMTGRGGPYIRPGWMQYSQVEFSPEPPIINFPDIL